VRRLLAACLGLAALSLLLPSEPSYDPWAWIVWGREVALLSLDTTGGPSWKPLPVFFTTLFGPLSKIDAGLPPDLWLVVARAGGLLALAMAFRLARRLAGPSRSAGIAAGVIAAVAVGLTPLWLRFMAHGNEAPLAIGLMLWGVERHLDGERRHAVVLLFVACLLRPEVFPFLGLYGLWLWREERERRVLLLGLAVALPALWLVPEWLGSGDPLAAGTQARSEPSWSLSLKEHPWLAALRRVHNIAGLPLELGTLAAVSLAGLRRYRLGSQHPAAAADRAALALGAIALLWVALVVAMVQAGFSGSPRYFLPAVVLICVLAGVGAARLVQALPGRVLAVAAAVGLAALAYPLAERRLNGFERQGRNADRLAALQEDLAAAVRDAGGPTALAAMGDPGVNRSLFVTRLAWESKLPIRSVEVGNGLMFATSARMSGRPAGLPRMQSGDGRRVAGAGAWRVLRFERTRAKAPPQSGRNVKIAR